MKRTIVITGIALIILFIIATVAFMLSTSVDKAYISSFEGDVQIQHNGRWGVTQLGEDLYPEDVIQTATGSSATVIIHESVIIRLAEGTRITIEDLDKDHITIAQQAGTTWNKLLELNDVTSYNIRTTRGVMTADNAEFSVAEGKVVLIEGKVYVDTNGQGYELDDGKVMAIGNDVDITNTTVTQLQSMIDSAEDTRQTLMDLRQHEIDKSMPTIRLLSIVRDIDEAQMLDDMKMIDEGMAEPDEVYEKMPIKTSSIRRAIDISTQIRKERELIQHLQGQ